MLLASIQGIREELGFDDMTDINSAIRAALNAAEPILAAKLGTSFEAGTYTDTFFIASPGYRDGNSYQTEFKLRHGFISSVTSVGSAYYAVDFATPASVTDYLAAYEMNLEKGVGSDYQTNYANQFIRFVYDAGFDADGSDPNSYDLDQVPDWLQEAAKLQALMLLASNPALKSADVNLDTKLLAAQLGAIVSQHIRYSPVAMLPL